MPKPALESTYQKQPMTIPVLVNQDFGHRSRTISTPQPVPVHITKRNQLPNNITERTIPQRSVSTSPNTLKTLVVGDSIFKEINPKGLENGVRICTKNGAMINDIWDEIGVYDLKSFQNVILCIGGNDSSSRTETNIFEEKYDELLRYIKAANKNCLVYLCKVVPRGDADVTGINSSIERVANHWRMHQVKIVASTNELFFGSDGLPCGRYYSRDGIHMSLSGTKRLIDAINRHVVIVRDFQSCVYRSLNQQQNRSDRRRPGARQYHGGYTHATPYGRANRNAQFNGQWTNQRRICFACSMPGHVISECWFTQ